MRSLQIHVRKFTFRRYFTLSTHTSYGRLEERGGRDGVTLAALTATSKATDDYENAYTHFPSETDTWSPILKGGEALQC